MIPRKTTATLQHCNAFSNCNEFGTIVPQQIMITISFSVVYKFSLNGRPSFGVHLALLDEEITPITSFFTKSLT